VRIAEAARRLFSERGFDRTSIRGVAAAAGVDPALVHHYFGTKDRLFLSVLELPFDPAERIPALLAGDADRIGERVVRFALDLWESDATRPTMHAIVRSATSDSEASGIMRAFISGPFGSLAAGLGVPDAERRVTLAASQLFGLALLRYVLRIEPLASVDRDWVVAAVAPIIQRYLTGGLPTRSTAQAQAIERSLPP
jgi:AcrR family transcriptional regulator